MNIWLSVKFRAFGITFGTVQEKFSLNVNLQNPVKSSFTIQSWTVPDPLTTKPLYNSRGVQLVIG